MRGAPLTAVQELLARSTIQMTMRYTDLGPEVVRDAVGLLDQKAVAAQSLGSARPCSA